MITLKQARAKAKSKNQTTREAKPKRSFLALLQKLGKALLYPVAILPFAAIFLRFGAEIPGGDTAPLFAQWIAGLFNTVGNAVFGNLAVIFAVGIGFGFAKDNRGEAALTTLVFFMAMGFILNSSGFDFVDKIYGNVQLASAHQITNGTYHAVSHGGKGFHAIFDLFTGFDGSGKETFKNNYDSYLGNNVFTGIICGGVVAWIYNKFNGLELPSVLGFFSGRRLTPVLTFIASWGFGILYALLFPWVGFVLYYFGSAMSDATGSRWGRAGIQLAYGTSNRLLLALGLHNVINVPMWFTPMGGSHPINIADPSKGTAFGDIFVFLNGDAHGNNSGAFQAGFFPVMMFGLPAVAFTIWKNAEPGDQKRKVAAVFMGSAMVSFFTGITEPIEYSFLFLAPVLFIIHALLTGISGFIVGAMGIQLGFGFSAGFTDYLLSIPKSLDIIRVNKSGINAVLANPIWIFIIGPVIAVAYYYSMNWAIKRFNIDTPGRGVNKIGGDAESTPIAVGENKYTADSKRILLAVGGVTNVKSLGNCATRLRFVLKDNTKVDQSLIKQTKAQGQLKVAGGYQVIMGPTVEMFSEEINRLMKSGESLKVWDAKKTVSKKVNSTSKITVSGVADGTVASLASLKDGVFSEKMMGDGIVVKFPASTKTGSVYAPVSGELVTVFPTGHAYGIKTKEGVEVLIHIGVDTVNLNGKGFKALVKQGATVKAGDKLADVDVADVRKAAPSADPIVLVTSGQKITAKAKGEVTKATKLFVTE